MFQGKKGLSKRLSLAALCVNFLMRMSDERLAWLIGEIVSRSGGKIVSVNRSEPSNFPFGVRGPAEYLELEMSDGTRRKVIFGPYAMPVEILD